jgi:iron(III) transport system substrate-binding protein
MVLSHRQQTRYSRRCSPGQLRSFHPDVKEKPGRTPFRDIKVMKEDAAAVEKNAEAIKAHYIKLFRV